MEVKNIIQIIFSPTHTTQKVISRISEGVKVKSINTINLTKPVIRKSFNPRFKSNDLLIIGVPVYDERIPEVVKEPLNKLKGQGQPVILIALYGNVGSGIALLQLNSLVKKAGFKVIGAASFIGEHSFSNDELEVAKGRPDEADLKMAEKFGVMITKKLKYLDDIKGAKELRIDGKLPLMARILPKNSTRIFSKRPEVDNQKCNQCGLCVTVCPVGAIDNKLKINEEICLRCFACVRKCPVKAREINFKKKWLVKKILKKKSQDRKEPAIYL